MPPRDVQIHGSIYQFIRRSGKLIKAKRWGYVTFDSLLIFPDAYNSNSCYKIYLDKGKIGISYNDDDNPWITITEANNVTYFIQPLKAHKFQKWLNALHKASNHSLGRELNANSEVRNDHSAIMNSISESPADPNRFTPTAEPFIGSRRMREKPIPIDRMKTNEPTPPELPVRVQSSRSKEATSKKRERGRTQVKSKLSMNAPSDCDLSAGGSQPVATRSSHTTKGIPPPRPPRSGAALQTVKEHSNMKDTEVTETKPFSEIRSLYPVSGLAKRMSICASDLLGKSRDELILLLLQLNREKANLQRWYDYFVHQIESIHNIKGDSQDAAEEIAAIQVELHDVIEQLSLSEPLVKFLSNMLRMGDMYHGDEVMFASEYRKHLLSPQDIVPPKPSINFSRDVEARDVARILNASRRELQRDETTKQPPGSATPIPRPRERKYDENVDLVSENSRGSDKSSRTFREWPESANTRQRRIQLEEELASLEALCAPHSAIHDELRATQYSLLTSGPYSREGDESKPFVSSGLSASLVQPMKSDHSNNDSSTRESHFSSLRNIDYPEGRYFISDDLKTPIEYLPQNIYGVSNVMGLPNSTEKLGRFTSIGSKRPSRLQECAKHFRSIPEHLNLLTQAGYPVNRLQPLNTEWKIDGFRSTDSTPTKMSPESSERFNFQPSTDDVLHHAIAKESLINLRNRRSQDYGVGYTTKYGTRATTPSSVQQPTDSAYVFRYEPYRRSRSDFIPDGNRDFLVQGTKLPRNVDEQVDENMFARNINIGSTVQNPVRSNHQGSGSWRQSDLQTHSSTEPRPGIGQSTSPLDKHHLAQSTSSIRNERIDSSTLYPGTSVYKEHLSRISPRESSPRTCVDPSVTHGRFGDMSCGYEPGQSHRSQCRLRQHRTEEDLVGGNWVYVDPNVQETRRASDVSGEEEVESLLSLNAGRPEHNVLREALLQSSQDEPINALCARLSKTTYSDIYKLDRRFSNNADATGQFLKSSETNQLPGRPVKTTQQDDVLLRSHRGRRKASKEEFSAETIDRVLTTPEPMIIGERYVPSPPSHEPSDVDYQLNKEAKLNAVRSVLMNQSLSQGSELLSHNTQSGSKVDFSSVLEERSQLLITRQLLAKEAAAAVVSYAANSAAPHRPLNV